MKFSCCPICGANMIKVVSGKISFQTPRGKIIVPNITRQKCFACNEEFFNHQANLILDEYRCRKKLLKAA